MAFHSVAGAITLENSDRETGKIEVVFTPRDSLVLSAGDRFNNGVIGTANKNDFLFRIGLKWNFGKKK